MCTISVNNIMKNRSYPEAGVALFDAIVANMDSEKIILDMTDVTTMPSMFLNTSLGKFIEVYGVDLLRSKIAFAKITATQASRIKEYINRIG